MGFINLLRRKRNRKSPQLTQMIAPVFSGRKQIGILDHGTNRLKLFGNSHVFFVTGTQPGAVIKNRRGYKIGQLGHNSQIYLYYRG